MDVSPEVEPILDAIILSFLACEKARRRKTGAGGIAAVGAA